MPTRCNRWFLLQSLLLAQHVSGTIIPIIRSSKVLYKWLLPVVFGAPHRADNLKTKAPNTTGSNHLYNTFELLMMGIMVPKTCWANSKICNKNHLLHLVGILFPHIRTGICISHEVWGSGSEKHDSAMPCTSVNGFSLAEEAVHCFGTETTNQITWH